MNFTEESLLEFLNRFPTGYKHASNMITKLKNRDHIEFLLKYANEYKVYDQYFHVDNIEKSVDYWNRYIEFIRENNKNDIGKQMYTAQSKFESSVLEESIYRMFSNLENDIIKIGGIKAYSNMYFCPTSFIDFNKRSNVKIHTKDQDFAIYKKIEINISDNEITTYAFVPVVAIECKTYLDKTMLEGSIATADKIKSGNPYCRFCIVTESYDVDYKVDIKYSRIDQIYVLCKGKRKQSNIRIEKDVVERIYNDTINHLNAKWSDTEYNIREFGVVIG